MVNDESLGPQHDEVVDDTGDAEVTIKLCSRVNAPVPGAAILNLHERIENKLFLDRTRKDSNFKRPHIYATLFQIEKCCDAIALLAHERALEYVCRRGVPAGAFRDATLR
jgi:hypothetical protein